MKHSRTVVFVATIVVAVGLAAALGALWLDPARAAVGPLPARGLLLPADARFLIGCDVQRLTSSPFYARFGKDRALQPDALRVLEEKTGINPARDVQQIVIAGTGATRESPGLALVTGHFDLGKLGRTLETEGRARGYNHEGVTVYAFKEEGPQPVAVAFLGGDALLFGTRDRVEQGVSSSTRGDAPLRGNAGLMALLQRLRPGSTFWMVGDQSLLAGLPASLPAPGAGGGASISLPALRSLTVTGDLDPQVSLSVTAEAADEPGAKNLADVVRGLVALGSLQAQQKPELAQLASAVTVATEGNRVLVSARVPYATLEALQAGATAARPAAPPPPPAQ
ncbi:MAG TPA: hypothetical protein VMX54_11585 [Vicinamibacteria bacterium]|nr:hypothetical protein [Vicinamibacteria bacterium]